MDQHIPHYTLVINYMNETINICIAELHVFFNPRLLNNSGPLRFIRRGTTAAKDQKWNV